MQTSPDFELLFRSAPGCYLVLSTDFTIVAATDTYLRATMTQHDVVGKSVFDAFPFGPSDRHHDSETCLRRSLERVLLHKLPDRMPARKYTMRTAESACGTATEARDWSLLNTPVPALDGQVGQIILSIDDVTDRVQRVDTLPEADQAQAASAAKSEFLSSMSHELRTPLNSILGFAQLLLRDTKVTLGPRHRARVDQILRGGEHLLRLVDDVLELARIEAGRVSVSAQPLELCEVLGEVTAMLQPMASGHEVSIELEPVRPDLPRIHADRARLTQILMNFGSNAIKYNRPGGHVVLRVERQGAALRVVVEDDGLGIALDQQPKLFQAFQRAGQEVGPIEGTGIGLLIAKRLAEIMGGRVGFQSVPAQGSSFWVELPVSEPRAVETGGLVVYVEDNPANIAFMTDLFEGLEGYQLVTARSAEQGLLLSRSLRPEIVVMDINLPGMSGTQALSAMRQAPETSHIPVIAVTASASERDRKHGEQAGFFRYLTKPLNVDELVSAIHAALERASLPLRA